MKITVDPKTDAAIGEPTDVQLQSEALQADKDKSARIEVDLLRQHNLSKELSQPAPEPEPHANLLKNALSGTIEERMMEEKSIYISFKNGQRADVVFTGFWNGKLVGNAMNAISRAYRVQRHKPIRANAQMLNEVQSN